MPDSDNEKSAALDKVVGAFRARRERASDDAPTGDATASADDPTPVVKLGDSDAPEPKGGDSESPTRAFKVPAEVAAAAAAATGGETANGDDARTSAASTSGKSAGLVEETVVGEPTNAIASETDDHRADDHRVEDPATSSVVEESVDVDTADGDTADGDTEDGDTADGDTAEEAEPAGSDSTPTEQIAVPAAAAAAAAAATTKIDTQKPAADGADDKTAKIAAAAPTPKPEQAQAQQPQATPQQQAAPQVIAPADAPAKKGRGKIVAALIVALIVIAAIAVGVWYLLKDNSPESAVADVATSYQEAMNDGDLSKLRDITCGEENKYYTTVSEEDFSKAYETQKSRNEMMTFDDVDSVAIDGDTARAGVDMYNTNDSSKKVPAQITMHKVGDDWKVCTKVN
ncbi:Rv0361 family membrane protein [Gordonia sp. MP11Mi]|uniref:DUF4878 domain-containing protein n=1 Tax=Gordonia sp. MP11Mi TaxID=3022769 RepID=A0AA97CW30_9ACTN